MAGYSYNREENLQIKYLRKVLTDVDNRIITPDSVRASSLRARLDAVPVPRPKEKALHFVLPGGLHSLRTAIPYAAAFALIVGLFYGLGLNRQSDMVSGSIPIAAPSQADSALSSRAANNPGEPETFMQGGADIPNTVDESAPAADTIDGAPLALSSGESESLNVGGSSQAVLLGSFGEYVLASRTADPADPDRNPDSLITLEILDVNANVLISQLDLPFMETVDRFFIENQSIALVGVSEQGTVVCCVNLDDTSMPELLSFTVQQGTLSSARVFDGILHVVSFLENPQSFVSEGATPLPQSAENGLCSITALSLDDGRYRQAAFSGSSERTDLGDSSADIFFLDEQDVTRVASISLQELGIQLEDVSAASDR